MSKLHNTSIHKNVYNKIISIDKQYKSNIILTPDLVLALRPSLAKSERAEKWL